MCLVCLPSGRQMRTSLQPVPLAPGNLTQRRVHSRVARARNPRNAFSYLLWAHMFSLNAHSLLLANYSVNILRSCDDFLAAGASSAPAPAPTSAPLPCRVALLLESDGRGDMALELRNRKRKSRYTRRGPKVTGLLQYLQMRMKYKCFFKWNL